MLSSAVRTFTDPDAYHAAIRDAHAEGVITARGKFRAESTMIRLDRLSLQRCGESLPKTVYSAVDPEVLGVIFATSSGQQVHINGLELERYSEAVVGKAVGAAPAARILRPAARNSAQLLRRHAQACRLAETRPKMLAHPEVARALEQGIIHALMTCLQTTRAAGNGLARQHHRRAMIRFEEVLAERLSQPLRMQQLCELIGVGERTLRSCCAEFLGVSPSQYVLLRRLKQARIALRGTNPATASVAEIARACGFTELGRFAGVYQSAFGETPSATLRRPPGSASISPKFSESA